MKKVMSLVMTAMVMGGMVAGCGNKEATTSVNNTGKATDKASNDTEEDPITFYETSSKTKTLNPHTMQSTEESKVMGRIYGNLLEMVVNDKGDNYEVIPNHAKSLPTMSEDGLTWTFELKDGVVWSDGTPITAKTYEYSYKMLLDPILKNYRANTFFASLEIVNAKKYFEGQCTWEEVGIKTKDNKLTFTLAYPVPEIDFRNMFMGGGVTSPVKEDLYESCFIKDRTENDYGTSVEKVASSGPYVLTEWIRDQNKIYEKNEKYLLANYYTPNRIESRVVEDSTSRLSLFESGETDYVTLGGTNYDKYSEDPRVVFSESNGIWYLFINQTSKSNPILGNLDLRNALYYGVDREKLAKGVLKTAMPAPYYVSSFKFVKEGVSYRDTEVAKKLVPENQGFNTDKAKKLFDKAYETNGKKKIVLSLQYFDSDEYMKKMAEILEEEYENLFGNDKIDVELRAVPFQAASDNMVSGKYDISFGAWNGGTFNPWSSMETYTSNYPRKNDKFYNEEFDKLYHDTVKGDLIFKEEERIAALGRMEEILFENMPFVPLFQTRTAFLFSDRITLKTGGKYLPGVGFGELQADMQSK